MKRWLAAALHGVLFGVLMVLLGTGIIDHLFDHQWETLTQPRFWVRALIVFAASAIIATVLSSKVLWDPNEDLTKTPRGRLLLVLVVVVAAVALLAVFLSAAFHRPH
jgi:hypothetical protein